MSWSIRSLLISDYAEVRTLWESSEGVGLNESDSEPALRAYLERNPGMSAVALMETRIVGAVLCGHDGRRGYLHHLAVSLPYRRQGIGRALVDWCHDRLVEAGIDRCNLFLYRDNLQGAAFWLRDGWVPRDELRVLQKKLDR